MGKYRQLVTILEENIQLLSFMVCSIEELNVFKKGLGL